MILSAKGEPFKAMWRAQEAIEGKPGYEVVEYKGGFAGSNKIKTMDVICPGCGQSYHGTTSSYSPDKDANPAMIQLKEPWLGWGWDDLGKDPSAGYGCLVCPDCGSALAPSGTLTVK
jgi:hypothetical protein